MDYNSLARSAVNSIHKVGKVSKLYGTEGEVVVKLYDVLTAREFIEITKGEPLWIEVDTIATPFFVSSAKSQGAGAAVVTFDYMDSEKKAALVVGGDVFLKSVVRERERAGDWGELLGYTFEDVTSGMRGVIREIVDNSLNPLMLVGFEGSREVFVPLSEDLIVGFDAKDKVVSFELVEGFFSHQW
ncbi:MAG: hypothetical protein R3Y61_05170 [Rikenellaceae bacterium]